MNLDNMYIHTECALVEEDDFEEARSIGSKIMDFVRKNKYLSIAANQVGYQKQIVVAMDNDGYDTYFNPEVTPQEVSDSLVSITPISFEFPAIIPSFPKKKVLCQLYENVEVDVFSVANDDRINFKASGDLAKLWQINAIILNGIDEESIVACDFMTIRGTEKKKPNAKCPRCGFKNKKCKC